METTEDIKAPMFTRKQLYMLIIPLIIEQLLAITVGMADTVMVSNVGEAAVSGISLVDTINNLLITIFTALATGGAVVVSQYVRTRRHPKGDRGGQTGLSGHPGFISAADGTGTAVQ